MNKKHHIFSTWKASEKSFFALFSSTLILTQGTIQASPSEPAKDSSNTIPVAVDDIKPPLAKQDFNEEQMRITKIVYKRILDKQNKDKNTHTLSAYTEKINSGARFEMLPVKGGTFTWKGEKEGDSLQATLSPFWMGKTEVTWDEYEPFMISEIPREKDGQMNQFMRETHKNDIDFIARPTTQYYPITHGMQTKDRPAIGMTQHAANKYCQWISYQTGHFHRLPTEAEWEYVCRAGSQTKYSWGNEPKSATQYAWFYGEKNSHYKKPGQKKPNAWGFLDMHGNVLEWTLDQYTPNRKSYFNKEKVTNPWVKVTQYHPIVTKGGHWKHKLPGITAAARHPSNPLWKDTDPQIPRSQWFFSDTPGLGMRVVRPLKTPTVEEMYHYWNSSVAADPTMKIK
ncbi:MAG: sulfatase activating formylglycine-generating enzyme [Cryomorphaceae bacterium]|jgi:formylglycine-generating enzyme required for sulfatase activity